MQTNGLTLCRALADRLPRGYLTPVPGDGRPYGQVLLDASVIYVRFLSALQSAGLRPHYAVHVTGHGWRKLMRLFGAVRLSDQRGANAAAHFPFHPGKRAGG